MENTLRKMGEPLFLVFICASVAPLILYEFEFNTPYYWAFKYLSLPIIVSTFVLSRLLLPRWHAESGFFKAYGMTLLMALGLLLCSGSYVVGFNALVGEQKSVQIEGIVVRKSDTTTIVVKKSHSSFNFTIRDVNSNKETTLSTTEKELKNVHVGQLYSQEWIIGSLGLMYKKK